jgi:alanine racemase
VFERGLGAEAGGVQCPILVLGAIYEDQIADCLDFGLEFSISSRLRAAQTAACCREKNRVAAVHLEVDTGMRRTGVRPETAYELFHHMKSQGCFDIRGIYSHFATADGPNDPFVQEQISAFRSLQQRLGSDAKHCLWHLANSGGTWFYPESHFDMVRPGIVCYGITPDGSSDPTLIPVFSLKAKVSFFKVVYGGQGISYGHRYITREQTRVVTVPVGFGDGYTRQLSNKAPVLIRGKRYTVAGTVCMDQFMVDIGGGESYVGDEAVLVGRQGEEVVSIWELARLIGSSPWEILCLFNNRIPRYYLDLK